ncbi:membrane transport protein [Streptomyces mobaraensis NBRC 13819 = DSM 40847]|uniref:Putative proline/betaine transporter n=1 Tax=Streptomyces mobaraensis (strain ATCC 29032 / DSM 40847 / JCM 4168 / NBRC 13819 / NCIMB 11159 / IPCR 16-22) TaxID=1223523 RepID=M3C3T7_STRM1|nr:membrane transport protein [Streptomyces mobaraensis NBRC 13819 = DSM 40847]
MGAERRRTPKTVRGAPARGGTSSTDRLLRTLLRRSKSSLSIEEVTVADRPEVRRAVSAAALGNMMEWFDFGVYAYVAATLGKVFFPSSSPGAQVISAFATFAAAFLVRPLGGLVFGPLGDRVGRQRVLAATMIMMAVSTFAVGLLPTYGTIGVAAPVLLLLCRLVQGFSTGGEYAGATTYIAEYAPDKRRGFLGSWLDFGTFVGYALGSGLVTVLTAVLGDDGMTDWGWRLPFLLAGPLGLIGLYMRMRLEETPAFRAAAEAGVAPAARDEEAVAEGAEEARQSGHGRLREIFTKHWHAVLICMGLVIVYNVTNYLVTSYLPTYMTETLGKDPTTAQLLILGTMIVVALTITTVGRSSDQWGRRPMFMVGSAAMVALAIPAILLVRAGGVLLPALGCLMLGLLLVVFAGTAASTLPALFPTRMRYGALSVSFNISVSLFGGTTPLVVSALLEQSGDRMIPAYYLMGAGVVGFVSAFFLHETAGKPLRGSGPMVESPEQARRLVARSRTEAGRRARDVWLHLRHPGRAHEESGPPDGPGDGRS